MTERGNILIVEDEKKIADTIKFGLEETGYKVTLAFDGEIGLHIFEANPCDLVILDVNLPRINGYQLCMKIRDLDPNIPILMLTAMGSLPDKIKGYDAGADDYMLKPFEFKELLMKIKALLKRSLQQPFSASTLLKALDLEMNTDSMEVRRAGRLISLTLKEFQLLEYLLRNKNRVVSRADISLKVWDVDFDSNTNVIDVFISLLRSKVDKGFDHKLIQTYIGSGYILKDH
ncbi:MAG: transcriptional regulator [Ferruginibacter sp.]|nr:transcriptional regulator [Ferruginibacter sp.]